MGWPGLGLLQVTDCRDKRAIAVKRDEWVGKNALKVCTGGANTGLCANLLGQAGQQIGAKSLRCAPARRLFLTGGSLQFHRALVALAAQRAALWVYRRRGRAGLHGACSVATVPANCVTGSSAPGGRKQQTPAKQALTPQSGGWTSLPIPARKSAHVGARCW